jgi:hypothetical protein
MFKFLIGTEISPLRSALILSHLGGWLLIFMGFLVWSIKLDDPASLIALTPAFLPYMLITVGVFRILFTILAGKEYAIALYLVILLGILKLIELMPANTGNDFNHIADFSYLILTGCIEIAFLWFVCKRDTWKELKETTNKNII